MCEKEIMFLKNYLFLTEERKPLKAISLCMYCFGSLILQFPSNGQSFLLYLLMQQKFADIEFLFFKSFFINTILV